MKTRLLILTLLISVFATQIQAQDRTIINAKNSEISDNLDLRAVASILEIPIIFKILKED